MADFFLFIEFKWLNFVFERECDAHGLTALMADVINWAVVEKRGGFARGEFVFSHEEMDCSSVFLVLDNFTAALAERCCGVL